MFKCFVLKKSTTEKGASFCLDLCKKVLINHFLSLPPIPNFAWLTDLCIKIHLVPQKFEKQPWDGLKWWRSESYRRPRGNDHLISENRDGGSLVIHTASLNGNSTHSPEQKAPPPCSSTSEDAWRQGPKASQIPSRSRLWVPLMD